MGAPVNTQAFYTSVQAHRNLYESSSCCHETCNSVYSSRVPGEDYNTTPHTRQKIMEEDKIYHRLYYFPFAQPQTQFINTCKTFKKNAPLLATYSPQKIIYTETCQTYWKMYTPGVSNPWIAIYLSIDMGRLGTHFCVAYPLVQGSLNGRLWSG